MRLAAAASAALRELGVAPLDAPAPVEPGEPLAEPAQICLQVKHCSRCLHQIVLSNCIKLNVCYLLRIEIRNIVSLYAFLTEFKKGRDSQFDSFSCVLPHSFFGVILMIFFKRKLVRVIWSDSNLITI